VCGLNGPDFLNPILFEKRGQMRRSAGGFNGVSCNLCCFYGLFTNLLKVAGKSSSGSKTGFSGCPNLDSAILRSPILISKSAVFIHLSQFVNTP